MLLVIIVSLITSPLFALLIMVMTHYINGGSSGAGGGGGGGGNGLIGESHSYTLLMHLPRAYPSQSGLRILPFMNLATFTREWAALHSMRSQKLLPLAPYILKASPVVSVSRLR